ncbi:hypothetical protein TARUN_8178 [Trichoderma arundinaceum]|uniref:Uncharacterized protein n=1 Tax=Trichoderma arundinaceum TaxID=490622 RepID=A0A395ND96_TRIAR|nr:hypothetical protein TARUN_8178 [Trichoderma arundinaceum]
MAQLNNKPLLGRPCPDSMHGVHSLRQRTYVWALASPISTGCQQQSASMMPLFSFSLQTTRLLGQDEVSISLVSQLFGHVNALLEHGQAGPLTFGAGNRALLLLYLDTIGHKWRPEAMRQANGASWRVWEDESSISLLYAAFLQVAERFALGHVGWDVGIWDKRAPQKATAKGDPKCCATKLAQASLQQRREC